MQGQRSIFDPFPETVDLNQGSNPNTTSMDETDDWNNMLSPMERRLLNNDLSNELNFSCVNTNRHNSFISWDVGESSSRASLRDQVSKDGQYWSNSAAHASRLEQPHRESSTTPMNVNLNVGYESTNSDDDGIGPSDSRLGSSFDHWGLSCKRKTLEGTSSQSLMGGASGCFPEASRSLNVSSGLNVSSAQVNHVPTNRHETPNTRIGVPESSPTPTPPPFDTRGSVLNLNNNDNISTGNPVRRSNINSSHQSLNRQILLNEFLDQSQGQISNNLSNPQPPFVHAPDVPRNTHHFPWGANIGSRSGGSSSSSLLRNNVQYQNFVPPSDGRNSVQDPTNWSLATGSGGLGAGASSSSSRTSGGNGGSRSLNGLWTSHLNNHTAPSQQRPSEFPPWTLFPSAEVESGGQRGHISSFSGGSSSSDDNRVSSGGSSQRHHYQPFSRAALLMEVPGDDWRALAADIEGRQRLVSEIRQVLNAMRRGENLRAEDYMLFDPFINGVAELHDRHSDMRLDVDNMSYEELLALEERIGDVNTGLSEEVILKTMRQRKHIAFMAISAQNLEPCCICQEEYDTGDNIGSLDCGHDFHTDCLKQWLAQKNICPICKMTGLAP